MEEGLGDFNFQVTRLWYCLTCKKEWTDKRKHLQFVFFSKEISSVSTNIQEMLTKVMENEREGFCKSCNRVILFFFFFSNSN